MLCHANYNSYFSLASCCCCSCECWRCCLAGYMFPSHFLSQFMAGKGCLPLSCSSFLSSLSLPLDSDSASNLFACVWRDLWHIRRYSCYTANVFHSSLVRYRTYSVFRVFQTCSMCVLGRRGRDIAFSIHNLNERFAVKGTAKSCEDILRRRAHCEEIYAKDSNFSTLSNNWH